MWQGGDAECAAAIRGGGGRHLRRGCNDGRRTPGVDGVLWNTPAKKMAAALSLTDKRYRARPLRRVYIEKKDKKKKRPLGIPTMYDRAMQALYALALEPVAETTADGKSFGFRKGRCAQDACEYLFNALSRKHISPKWAFFSFSEA